MATTLSDITVGTTEVRYHGSLNDQWGLYFVVEICECKACDDADDYRYDNKLPLTDDDVRLMLASVLHDGNGRRTVVNHVRLSSVTLL